LALPETTLVISPKSTVPGKVLISIPSQNQVHWILWWYGNLMMVWQPYSGMARLVSLLCVYWLN